MAVYNVITALCFAALAAAAGYFFVNLLRKDRAGKIAYLRGFKRGKCVVVFIFAVPLMFIGYYFGGNSFMESLFLSVSNIFDFVVLKIELGGVEKLMLANRFYKVAVYFCCLIVFVNAVLFVFSFVGQQLWHMFRDIKAKLGKKAGLLIFDNNEHSQNVYLSAKEYDAVILDKLSSEDMYGLYVKNIKYKNSSDFGKIAERTVGYVSKKQKKIYVVINTLSDETNLGICRLFNEALNKLGEEEKRVIFKKLSVYVFGSPSHEAVYEQAVDRSFGCLQYVNKYRIIAMNFIDKYPLTEFMNETHIDYETGLLHDSVKINVCMIGFGNTNRQIFLTSVANNQFLAKGKGAVYSKRVKYCIFDKNYAEENKNLNHSYYRYRNEFLNDKNPPCGTYLPAPVLPAKEKYFHLDINSPKFYQNIKSCVSGENSVNCVIISFGTDLENIDLALKLAEKRKEWGMENLALFVKVDKNDKNQSLSDIKNCYFIGNMSADVYNISEIVKDKFCKMAHMRNEVYDLEYNITHNKSGVLNERSVLECKENSDKKWHLRMTRLERESSLYCCLSLKSKLHLMGLDYITEKAAKENNRSILTEEQYLEKYAKEDMPQYYKTENNAVLCANGKKIVKYPLDFPDSKRKSFAELEHLRWNAFMLSKGMVPASKETILNDKTEKDGKTVYTNGKSYELRRHGNITTFEGLIEFRKMIAERNGTSEAEEDVIKYDYQILDDAFWLLHENGFAIVEKKKQQP